MNDIAKYPPHTDDLQKLAEFFDKEDTTKLKELEEVSEIPKREGTQG
jgi:hypothetical protein